MNEAALVFPHQLFENNPAIKGERVIIFVEDPLFFGDIKFPLNFHKNKLAYQRAAFRSYHSKVAVNCKTAYFDYPNLSKNPNIVFDYLNKNNISKIHLVDPVDFILEKRIKKSAEKTKIELELYHSPSFISDGNWLKEYFSDKTGYFLTKFYIEQRKRLKILVDKNNKPIGGKWSYDVDNRKKMPKDVKIPEINFYPNNDYHEEARAYVSKHFPNNPGSIDGNHFPINHEEALDWLDNFLKTRLQYFGKYQDALVKDQSYLFHSLLSPLLNNGLLTPDTVVSKSLDFALKNNIELNSIEGFIRQIIGWREFILAIYKFDGVHQRNSNFFKNTNPLPQSFYNGTTGIGPIDNTIGRLLSTSYNHHIERLMILGNFMLLCEIHPTEVYKWFMEMYIDSYDWVMVPNVYGMSQFADGGMMSTKPYISSSNYILKMSDYKKGDWCKIWDGLFWRFVNKHKEYFAQNPRTFFMNKQLEKMDQSKLKEHITNAENYLDKLFSGSVI